MLLHNAVTNHGLLLLNSERLCRVCEQTRFSNANLRKPYTLELLKFESFILFIRSKSEYIFFSNEQIRMYALQPIADGAFICVQVSPTCSTRNQLNIGRSIARTVSFVRCVLD